MAARIEDLLARLTLKEKVALLSGQDFWQLPGAATIGMRPVVMSDGPIGVRGTAWAPDRPSVAMPSPTALAATWDVALARETGRLLGQAARRAGVDVLLAPTVNLHRSPLGGRHFECYSEDPLLTGEIGAAYVAGVQDAGVAAAVKHFVANDSETDRLTVDVRVSERALRELYLTPFETIVRGARPWAVMAAYNRVNGVPLTEHHHLLREVLKEEWGFDGAVISDWTAARSTVDTANAGLDVAMPAMGSPWGPALVAAVKAGRVDEAVVDEQARRVLRLAQRVGALGPTAPAADSTGTRALAHRVATASFVLARNRDHLLPLDPARLRRVAVLGPAATDLRAMGGGSAEVVPSHVVSPLDGLAAALPSDVDIICRLGALAGTRLPPVRGHFRVRLLDHRGAELYTATVPEARVRWFGNPPPGVDPRELATVELRGTIAAAVDGEHTLAVAGVGGLQLYVDGVRVASVPAPAGADPGDLFAAPPETRVPTGLTAGRPADVHVVQQLVPVEGVPAFVSLCLGCAPLTEPDRLIDEAVQAAAEADVAVVFVGTTEEDESEGFDRAGLSLPGRQDELVARVAAVNPRTVVVVNSGAPVLLPWTDDVAAVLLVWFPGQEGGAAIADVLVGAAEPSGRLPTTWPRRAEDCPVLATTPADGVLRYDEDVFVGYRAWQRSATPPLFPFGHGHGYTQWTYEALTVEPGPGLGTVRVRVRNTGNRPGREVVQVYLGPAPDGEPPPGPDRPRRWLAGFAVAEARPGEALDVCVTLPARAAQVWYGGWRTLAGTYVVEAGRSVDDRRLSARLPVGG